MEVELVRVPFAVHFSHDVLIVVVPANGINFTVFNTRAFATFGLKWEIYLRARLSLS